MTNLERVRELLVETATAYGMPEGGYVEALKLLDAHLKEDAEQEAAHYRRGDEMAELRLELARLREVLRTSDRVKNIALDERDRLREEHGKGKCVPADEFERAKEPIFAEGMRAGCEDLMREAARMDEENARLREDRDIRQDVINELNVRLDRLREEVTAEHDENARLRSDLFLARQAEVDACKQRDRLRSRLTVLEAREEAFQKERSENTRLREALEAHEAAGRLVRYARYEETLQLIADDVLRPYLAPDRARNALKETTHEFHLYDVMEHNKDWHE